MAEKQKTAEKKVQYKTEDGKVLYGFSQTHLDDTKKRLEHTNRQLGNVVLGLKILIVLFAVLLAGAAIFFGWVAYNDVVTRMIYGY